MSRSESESLDLIQSQVYGDPFGLLCSSVYNMKLDATDLRYVTSEEFRVLTAVSLSQSLTECQCTIEMF